MIGRRASKIKSKLLHNLVYLVAIVAPLMTVPQLTQVLNGHTAGVSLTTWLTYATISLFWLIYGLRHNDKPIALSNFLLCVLDYAIVLGILIKG